MRLLVADLDLAQPLDRSGADNSWNDGAQREAVVQRNVNAVLTTSQVTISFVGTWKIMNKTGVRNLKNLGY